MAGDLVHCAGAQLAGLALLALLHRWRVRVLSARLRAAFEAERQAHARMANGLHDTLLQSLTAISLQVRAAANQVPAGSPPRARLELALRRASDALAESRDRVRELRGSAERSSLVESLTRLVQTVAVEVPAVRIELTTLGAPRALHEGVREEAYCIAREALFNALQHGQPDNVRVTVHFDARELVLAVRDDGRGIEAAVLEAAGRDAHWGIAGMHERARRIGAQLTLRPRRTGGTELLLQVPAVQAYALPVRHWWQPDGD